MENTSVEFGGGEQEHWLRDSRGIVGVWSHGCDECRNVGW